MITTDNEQWPTIVQNTLTIHSVYFLSDVVVWRKVICTKTSYLLCVWIFSPHITLFHWLSAKWAASRITITLEPKSHIPGQFLQFLNFSGVEDRICPKPFILVNGCNMHGCTFDLEVICCNYFLAINIAKTAPLWFFHCTRSTDPNWF